METFHHECREKKEELWPALPWDAWKDTCETLHMWTQIVGKVKLRLAPFLNEWWNVAFQVTARGLSTGVVPAGDRVFQADFDFFEHKLHVNVSDGQQETVSLFPRAVADFYAEFFAVVRSLGVEVAINTRPVETQPAIPFEQDRDHASYDGDYARRWWRILVQTTKVLQRYRSSFFGKSSPILFYWGSFDLNTARFSGRPAPVPAGPRFYQIAEDQENAACGFWPGNANANGLTLGAPAFYAYTYPAPEGFPRASVRPDASWYDEKFGEFLLRYDDVRTADAPEQVILDFFQSTYEAGAALAHWDRTRLEQRPDAVLERPTTSRGHDRVP